MIVNSVQVGVTEDIESEGRRLRKRWWKTAGIDVLIFVIGFYIFTLIDIAVLRGVRPWLRARRRRIATLPHEHEEL